MPWSGATQVRRSRRCVIAAHECPTCGSFLHADTRPLMETARGSGVGRGCGRGARAAPARSGLSDQYALALKGKPVGMNALGGQTLGFELIGISLIGNLLLGR